MTERILQVDARRKYLDEYAASLKQNNMKLLFLDTETTGLDAEDRVVEVGYSFNDGERTRTISERFKPPVPIKVGAMAVNHITNNMVADKETFDGSIFKARLAELSKEGYVLVAHNAPFDLAMLAKEGVVFENYIDTKKMSHALDPDQEMESHRLQYLRYYYGVELPEAEAHTAEGDIAVLEAVFNCLHEKLGKPSIEELMELSKRPVLHTKFKFGKYNGNDIASVAAVNPGYLEWLLKSKEENGQNEEDWIYTLKHYLNNL
jgi:DNA polymerase III alpha subunit (gram-positive type)